MKGHVLVVGGAGYIGSHMVLALDSAGYDVTVFDNLSRGHRDAVLAGRFIQGDIRSPDDLRRCFQTQSFDVVMHFAALAYVGESVTDPAAYYATNVQGSLNLLEAMREAQVGRIVFSSTCATYGEPEETPITEQHPQRPVNPYGWTKFFVERALADYGHAYGVKSICPRYFNAAGCDVKGRLGERHDPETHLIPLVLREAFRAHSGGDPDETQLRVFGDDFPTPDGTCVRDYIHVDDLCTAHLLAVKRLQDDAVVGSEAFNLGNGSGYSVREVIEACRRVTGSDIRYKVAPRRAGDPPQLVGSADRARTVMGWSPRITALDDIIGSAWAWFRRGTKLDVPR